MKGETTDSKGIITTVTAIAFIISAIDMIFYWNVFGINIFNHLTPGDILSRSITPLSSALASIAIISIVEIKKEVVEKKFDNIIEQKTKIDKTLGILLNFSPSLFFILAISIKYFTGSNFYVFFFVAFISTAIMQFSIGAGITQKIEDRFKIPFFIINMFISVGGIIVAHSTYSALQISEGKAYQRAEVFLMNKQTPIQKKYIGETKDTLFLQSFDTNEVIEIQKQFILRVIKSDKDCRECEFEIEKSNQPKPKQE